MPISLSTPAKVSCAFKMVSQFSLLGYTIMGKTADLTVVQKTIIDTRHKESKLQTFIAKEAGCSQSAVSKHVNRKLSGRKKCGRKRWSTNRENRRLMRIVKQNWLRHQEPSHTDISRNLATVVARGVLPGHRRRRTGLLPSGPNSSFQMRASFVFHLETKVLESGGRVEKLIAQVAWSPVLRFHSLWWFGVQCHLLVLVHCVFWKPTSLHPFTQNNLEHFMLPSADQLFKRRCWFNFPAWFGTCPHCQKHRKLVKWSWCWCAWLASKLTRPEPHRESIAGVLKVYIQRSESELSSTSKGQK